MLRKPERLKQGDKIGIFVPASPVRDSFRQKGMAKLEQLGYEPVEVDRILARQEFVAKPVEENLDDIQHLLDRIDIRALWAARGGYGSNYLLPHLKKLEIEKPKIVIGSSDVSYLLWYMLEHFNMVVFYGPMAFSALAENRVNLGQLQAVLSGTEPEMKIEGRVLIPGRARGILTGGCLSNLVSLIGTPFFPEIRQRILLLEDVNERPYRLDRMLWQLDQIGVFQKIRGLVLGEFPDCFKDDREKESFFSRLGDYLSGVSIPVLVDLPLGHSDSVQTIPLGIEVEMDTSDRSGLILRENAVE